MTAKKMRKPSRIPEISLHHAKCFHPHGYLMDDATSNSHNFYEINYCRNADVLFSVGKNQHFVSKGDILFIPPNVNHHFISCELVSNYFDFITLWLSEEYIQNILTFFPGATELFFQTPQILHTASGKYDFEKAFTGLYESSTSLGSLSEPYLCGTALCLLVRIMCHITQSPAEVTDASPDLLTRILAYVDNHYSQNIDLLELAATFYISKTSLNNLFQNNMGVSCYQYIIRKRLSASLKLIHSGTSLKNVATAVGFGDYSSFYRAFKKAYQMSPTEYLARKPELLNQPE